MTKLTAEQFLLQAQMVAETNNITLDSVEFTMPSGMRWPWYHMNDDDDDDGSVWANTDGMVSQ